jgi:hypothetical protein
MHQHVCTIMLLHLMINFNLVKNIISLCFHEHKNSKLTYFSSISKEANFRVLQKACCAWADNDCKSLSGGKTKIQKIGRKQNTRQWWGLSLPVETTTWQWCIGPFMVLAGSHRYHVTAGLCYNLAVIYPCRFKPQPGSEIFHIITGFRSCPSVLVAFGHWIHLSITTLILHGWSHLPPMLLVIKAVSWRLHCQRWGPPCRAI